MSLSSLTSEELVRAVDCSIDPTPLEQELAHKLHTALLKITELEQDNDWLRAVPDDD